MHQTWFPPVDPIHTGRLCSAGSEVPTSSPTSKLVCSPPTSSPPSAATSVPLVGGLPRYRSLFFAGRACPCQHAARRRRITGSPKDRVSSRRGEDLPGYWAVLFVRAMVEHPAGYDLSLPLLLFEKIHGEAIIAFGQNRTLGIRNVIVFEAVIPRLTRSRAYASPASLPRPSPGSLPARAGSPLAGRVSHPLDDDSKFHEAIAALHFPSTSRAWSHSTSYPHPL
jgi:hypothetical protein